LLGLRGLANTSRGGWHDWHPWERMAGAPSAVGAPAARGGRQLVLADFASLPRWGLPPVARGPPRSLLTLEGRLEGGGLPVGDRDTYTSE